MRNGRTRSEARSRHNGVAAAFIRARSPNVMRSLLRGKTAKSGPVAHQTQICAPTTIIPIASVYRAKNPLVPPTSISSAAMRTMTIRTKHTAP
jgi:hypothetical protein